MAVLPELPPAPEREKQHPDRYVRMQLVAQVTDLKRLAARRLKCFAGTAVNPDDLETVINFLTALKPIVRLISSSFVVTHLMRRKTHGVLLPLGMTMGMIMRG